MNLKYSSDILNDFKKLSNGRKVYIQKRADVKDLSLSDYLNKKYGGK
jgi:hypothetical protein